MIVTRTDSNDPDFRRLVAELDRYLAESDGDEHAFYAQFNRVDNIANVVVVREGDDAVACGAFKPYSSDTAEIKRMFVRPEFRGRSLGAVVLAELESWAAESGFEFCILETGHKQKAAVRLYENCRYEVIPNYDQYEGVDSSVCMKKQIGRDRDAFV